MQTKQVIVMRHDIKVRKGKMCSQASHSSLAVFTNRMLKNDGNWVINLTPAMEEWLKDSFTKITVYVNSEQELFDIYNSAREKNIPCSLIQDSGRTEFHGVPTYTCCAIGPDYSDKIDKITGGLPLL